MVQEKLTRHDVERQVVQGPADEEEAAERVIFHDLGCRVRCEKKKQNHDSEH